MSGAHINPAVTFANWLVDCAYHIPDETNNISQACLESIPGRSSPFMRLLKCSEHFVLQALSMVNSPHLHNNYLLQPTHKYLGNYKSAIDVYEGGPNIRTVPGYSNHSTAGIFCTYPAEFMTKTGQFFSEFIASTILMFCIYALQDNGNLGAGNLTPLGLFFVIFGIGACFGWETGYAINLARDFGPRLMTYCLGYGHEVWSAGNYYFWVPMVAPFFGCTFGGWLYDVFLFTGSSLPTFLVLQHADQE